MQQNNYQLPEAKAKEIDARVQRLRGDQAVETANRWHVWLWLRRVWDQYGSCLRSRSLSSQGRIKGELMEPGNICFPVPAVFLTSPLYLLHLFRRGA